MVGPALTAAAPFLARAGQIAPWLLTGASFLPSIGQALNQPGMPSKSQGRRRGGSAPAASAKRPEGYSTYGTYTVGGIEYDINSGRPTYMPPGSVYPSSSVAPLKTPAGERAYQQEMSRVAQLTAQDPEFQRYENARKAAKSQEEMNAVRDMGMQMWQEKYKDTPMGRPGGAVGSFNPLMQKTFGYQAGMSPADLAQTITNPSPVPVAPGEAPIQTGDLGTRALLETGYDPAAFGITPEQIEEMKLKLLQQSKNQ